MLDTDRSGSLSSEEFCASLRKLVGSPWNIWAIMGLHKGLHKASWWGRLVFTTSLLDQATDAFLSSLSSVWVSSRQRPTYFPLARNPFCLGEPAHLAHRPACEAEALGRG